VSTKNKWTLKTHYPYPPQVGKFGRLLCDSKAQKGKSRGRKKIGSRNLSLRLPEAYAIKTERKMKFSDHRPLQSPMNAFGRRLVAPTAFVKGERRHIATAEIL
jgi:hypothetical protein